MLLVSGEVGDRSLLSDFQGPQVASLRASGCSLAPEGETKAPGFTSVSGTGLQVPAAIRPVAMWPHTCRSGAEP